MSGRAAWARRMASSGRLTEVDIRRRASVPRLPLRTVRVGSPSRPVAELLQGTSTTSCGRHGGVGRRDSRDGTSGRHVGLGRRDPRDRTHPRAMIRRLDVCSMPLGDWSSD